MDTRCARIDEAYQGHAIWMVCMCVMYVMYMYDMYIYVCMHCPFVELEETKRLAKRCGVVHDYINGQCAMIK